MSKHVTRVLLADGRKIFREGLCVLLEKHADLRVVGEADDPRAAVKLVSAVGADVVVLNPPQSTRDVAEIIRSIRQGAQTQVIVLSVHPDGTFIREILQAGALGCLAKDSASTELIEAIRSVAAGQMYLSPRISGTVVSDYVLDGRDTTRKRLAPREREILRRIADGENTKQIAMALRIGTKTVETHRRRIMEKLHKHSLAELTKYAIREGLTSLEVQS